MLAVARIGRALTVWPHRQAWRDTAIAAGLFFVIAVPLALTSGLASPEFELARDFPLLALRLLLVPSMVEELLFRALLNPHPLEAAPPSRRLSWAGVSLLCYVIAHPLNAWLFTPATRGVFDHPMFVLLVALLGTSTLVLYRRSGSLWPPLLLHWLVVSSWLAAGGQALLRGT